MHSTSKNGNLNNNNYGNDENKIEASPSSFYQNINNPNDLKLSYFVRRGDKILKTEESP